MPYPNEHACRIADPSKFQQDSFRRVRRKIHDKEADLIIGKLKGETSTTLQAVRFPKDIWDADDAAKICADLGGTFEPAREED